LVLDPGLRDGRECGRQGGLGAWAQYAYARPDVGVKMWEWVGTRGPGKLQTGSGPGAKTPGGGVVQVSIVSPSISWLIRRHRL
jgi:hypothetical protein